MVNQHGREDVSAGSHEDGSAGHTGGEARVDAILRGFLCRKAEAVLVGDERPSTVPNHHHDQHGDTDQNGHPAAIEELAEIGVEEREIKGQE